MKKIGLMTMTFVLTAAMLAACGCTNQSKNSTSAPTVLPTNEENWTTNAAASTTRATEPAGTSSGTGNGGATGSTGAGGMTTESTTDRGNGPLDDSTTEATASGGAANSGTSGNSGNSSGTGSSNG